MPTIPYKLRLAISFAVVFALYQSAEGIGGRLLHNGAVSAVLMLAAFLSAWPLSMWLGYKGFGAYGLSLRRDAGRILLAGLLLMMCVRLAAVFVGVAAGAHSLAPLPSVPSGLALAGVLVGAAITTFVPSVTEDILTRGFWLEAAKWKWPGLAYVLATSTIYVLNHLYRLGEGPVEWLRLFCFGLAYATAAWKYKTLWAAVGLHWGWNLTNALLDSFVDLNATQPQTTALLSAGAHLVVAVIVLLVPRAAETEKAD